MLTRSTLNARLPRTLRDTSRDPFDFIEVAHRSHWLTRWSRPLANALFVVLLFGSAGVLGFLYLAR